MKLKHLKYVTYLKYDNDQQFFIAVVLASPTGGEGYEESIADHTDEIQKVEDTVPHS